MMRKEILTFLQQWKHNLE